MLSLGRAVGRELCLAAAAGQRVAAWTDSPVREPELHGSRALFSYKFFMSPRFSLASHRQYHTMLQSGQGGIKWRTFSRIVACRSGQMNARWFSANSKSRVSMMSRAVQPQQPVWQTLKVLQGAGRRLSHAARGAPPRRAELLGKLLQDGRFADSAEIPWPPLQCGRAAIATLPLLLPVPSLCDPHPVMSQDADWDHAPDTPPLVLVPRRQNQAKFLFTFRRGPRKLRSLECGI